MDRDEILAASRRENKNQDIAEAEYIRQAGRVAYIVGCLVCCLICVLQGIFTNTINWGCWVVNFSILGTVFLVKSIKGKMRHEILVTIVYYGLCLLCTIGFIMSLRG